MWAHGNKPTAVAAARADIVVAGGAEALSLRVQEDHDRCEEIDDMVEDMLTRMSPPT